MKPSEIRNFILSQITTIDSTTIERISQLINGYFFGNSFPPFQVQHNDKLLRSVLVKDGVITFNKQFIKDIASFERDLEQGMLREMIKKKYPNEVHNQKMMSCLSNYIFNDELIDVVVHSIDSITKKDIVKERLDTMTSFVLYENRQNSCYIDSLLSVIFFADYGWYISQILRTDVTKIKYEKGVCSLGSNIKNMNTYASLVKLKLSKMFLDVDREIHTCSLIGLLSKCETRLKVGAMSNVAEAYELLCGLFPSLRIQYKRLESDGVYDREQCLFDMTDLPTLKEVLVSEPEVLTFSNGGISRGGGKRINWTKYGFGETILDGKYRIVGVVVHVHLSHYVAYFYVPSKTRNSKGHFYYYDDMVSNEAKMVASLPMIGIFQDSIAKQPAMFFYRRV